jgi:DNA-binding transcriptional LysR family regulator
VKARGKLGPRFDNYAMALQAAVDGVGVAIGLRPYVADDIEAAGSRSSIATVTAVLAA